MGDILFFIAKTHAIGRIELFSNGTVVPSEQVLRTMQTLKDRLLIDITFYGCMPIDKAVSAYEQYSIPFRVKELDWWIDHSNITYERKSVKELRTIAETSGCFNRKTIMFSVIDGKAVCHCRTAASIMYYLICILP